MTFYLNFSIFILQFSPSAKWIKDIHQMPKAETDYYGKVLRIITNKTIRLRNTYRLTITPIRALVSSGKAQLVISRNISWFNFFLDFVLADLTVLLHIFFWQIVLGYCRRSNRLVPAVFCEVGHDGTKDNDDSPYSGENLNVKENITEFNRLINIPTESSHDTDSVVQTVHNTKEGWDIQGSL